MKVSAAKTLSSLFKEGIQFQINLNLLKKNLKKIFKDITF